MEVAMQKDKVKPFDSFILLHKILGWAGYFKLIEKPKKYHLELLHHLYRFLIFNFVLIYNIIHILFIVHIANVDKDQAFDSMVIEIPQLNLIAKVVALYRGDGKLEKLRELMNDPIFAARSKRDEELLLENKNMFQRLTKNIIRGTCCSGLLWTLTSIFTRTQDKNYVVPIYVPFNTDSWLGFAFTILIEHGPVFWVGFAHLTMDILIACHYSQATVQLKIIKYNLEHICDSDKVPGYVGFKNNKVYRYLDDFDVNIKKRFIHYVQRYAKVIWFVRKSNDVFNSALSVQFFTTSSVFCLIIYKLSLITPGSVEFMFLAVYFLVLQVQVVLYCYFGELLRDESKFVTDAAYLSDWLSLSPSFRKQLLVAMTRWSIPITPYVAGIVPLALNTYVSLLRIAFNLYTVLKTTNDK